MTEETLELLKEKSYTELRHMLQNMNPVDVAQLLEELPGEHLALLFRILPKELAAEAFVEMDADTQEQLIKGFSDKELQEIIEQLFLDDTVDIIEEMPANVVQRILANADAQTRKAINEILNYPKDSAGSLMTIEYVNLKKNMTVAEAFERIRATGVDKETIYTCYVTGYDRKLLGLVSVKTLLLSDQTAKIEDIMETNIISVSTTDDREMVARLFEKYDFMALPVVDGERRLVGIVTFDDAIDVIQEETTKDFAKMAAISPSEDSYFKTSVWEHAKNRVVWLLILMLSATISGLIISNYEEAFSAIPLLVSFLPMLMNTGGNCGTQSSALVIRGLAIDEIHTSDIFKVWFKEVKISIIVSAILAVVNGIRVYLIHKDIKLSLILGLTLVGTVLVSKSLGSILPLLAKKCKLDPAVMATPVLTTIVDACSVFLYFKIATMVLGI